MTKVTSEQFLEQHVQVNWDVPIISFDVETDGLKAHRGARPFLLGTADEQGEVLTGEPGTRTWRIMKDKLRDPRLAKVAHNLKFELRMLGSMGIPIRGQLHDTMVMAHTLNEYEQSFKLERLAERYLGADTSNAIMIDNWKYANAPIYRKRLAREPNYSEIPRKLITPYLEDDVVTCLKLCYVFKERIERWFSTLYGWEIALVSVLMNMEERGIRIDTDYIAGKRKELGKQIAALLLKVHKEAGDDNFNPASPKQIANKLIEFGVEFSQADYTDKGNPRTDFETLKKYDSPFTNAVTEFRKKSKLKGTYFDGLAEKHNAHIIRCSFWQCSSSQDKGIRTARLSCSDPNLQNIPARDKVIVRKAFIPRDLCSLWFIDFHSFYFFFTFS